MTPEAAPLRTQLRLNTRLFSNCLDGVDDRAASLRPLADANSLAFVALHLVDVRHFLANFLHSGAPPHPFAALLAEVRTIQELSETPPLSQIREAWDAVSAALDARFGALTAGELASPAPQPFPVDDGTVLGALAFLAQHDAYHVGQMAMLRKALGFGAMRYG